MAPGPATEEAGHRAVETRQPRDQHEDVPLAVDERQARPTERRLSPDLVPQKPGIGRGVDADPLGQQHPRAEGERARHPAQERIVERHVRQEAQAREHQDGTRASIGASGENGQRHEEEAVVLVQTRHEDEEGQHGARRRPRERALAP